MIKITATAAIYAISPVIQVNEKFQKRELVLDDSWVDQQQQLHPNLVMIEFSGEAMNTLDNFAPGQRVTVEAYVNGREYNGRYYNSIRGKSVAPVQQMAQAQQTAGYAPQQFGAQPARQQYGGQPTPPPQAAYTADPFAGAREYPPQYPGQGKF